MLKDLENNLVNHVLDMEKSLFGVTARDLRRLAFQVELKLKASCLTKQNRDPVSDNYICIVCFEKFEYSRPGEQWIKCLYCNG